ncbi:MAG: AmmeMemoRadiSam system radical SAM enzyme [Chloroflexi bacterium]|nr:AmmeMemoRadiSam system radical SAM enzyme [Chloroflexota bacterium]
MREAMLYEKLENGAVRCHVCLWRCKVNRGKHGYCKTRVNLEGTFYTLIYGVVSSVAVDPIEKKPLFHFFPTSRVLSLGTLGCNFRCNHCQNWQISYAMHIGGRWLVEGRRTSHAEALSPEDSVRLAKTHGCVGLAWTYNEPAIWFEHTLDSARLAKQSGLYTAYVTNGYITSDGLDAIGPYLDAYRVDVKGFTDEAYGRIANLPKGHWRGILDVAARAKNVAKMHVEVVTNVVPGCNDDSRQLTAIACWIRDELGADTPWHVTRFHPHAGFGHVPPTPISSLDAARRTGLDVGLRFVYLGNVPGADSENTYCYRCGRLAVQRVGYRTALVGIGKGGKCQQCNADLNVRGI